MWVHCLLLTLALSCCCSAAGDHHDNMPAAMTMGAAQSPTQPDGDPNPAPRLAELIEDQQEARWRTEVLDLLKQLVLIQKEVAGGQVQVAQLLGTLGTQGSQQIQDLQNVARHQSLLVENHQALLLQTSRIATQLQELAKKPAAPPLTSQ